MMVGDVVGRSGRKTFQEYTPKLRKEKAIDIVIVNGENSADGNGITRTTLDALYHAGADIVTSGNHIWDKKDVLEFIDDEPFLIRPANYPGNAPGKGCCVYPFRAKNIGVINLSGRVFMQPLDCPFQKADELLRELKDSCDILLVDFHAEATSEKISMGWYLDGRVNAVIGTHTHVQTADEKLLPKGTAYLTDLGMVAPWNSVIGVKTDAILERFLTARPVRFEPAKGPSVYSAALIDIDDATNCTTGIERILIEETPS